MSRAKLLALQLLVAVVAVLLWQLLTTVPKHEPPITRQVRRDVTELLDRIRSSTKVR